MASENSKNKTQLSSTILLGIAALLAMVTFLKVVSSLTVPAKAKSIVDKAVEQAKTDASNIEKCLVDSKSLAEEIKKNAEKEAELRLREAKIKSERMLEETHAVLSNLRKQIIELKDSKKSYILRLKSILDTQLKILESMEREEEPYKREPGTPGEPGRQEGS